MTKTKNQEQQLTTIGLGGGCHWCTEAVYASLKGMVSVEQGWISSDYPNNGLSEAILIKFDEQLISLQDVIEIHLYTHSATSNHSMREKYRSAIYVLNNKDNNRVKALLKTLQTDFLKPLITQALNLKKFKKSEEKYLNYYYKNPDKPFCQAHIQPKLQLLIQRYRSVVDVDNVFLEE